MPTIQDILAITLGAFLLWAAPQAEAAETPPNIILFLADDLGYGDVESYGATDIKTPVMDSLAAEGARFTDGYAAFPVCSPSRAALMTGRYMQRFGPSFEDYFKAASPGLDPEKHPTIASMLQEAGYATGCFGKWNVSNTGRVPANEFGFDRWVGLHLNHDFYTHRLKANNKLDMYVDGEPTDQFEGTWSDTVFADEAIQFINENKDRPFFIYIPWQAPHEPIQDPDVPFAPHNGLTAEDRPVLVKMIERLDLETGRVLAALNENGLSENTLVIFTSDNGGERNIASNAPLRGAKQQLYEGGIRVPLLVRWPAMVPPGDVISTPVTGMDLTATIAAAAGIHPPQDAAFDGLSLLPVLKGSGQIPEDRALFFRRRNTDSLKGESFIRQSAVRQGDMKYIRTYKHLGGGQFSDEFNEELFNLDEDISESQNLINSEPDQLATMRSLFEAWETEMDRAWVTIPEVKHSGFQSDGRFFLELEGLATFGTYRVEESINLANWLFADRFTATTTNWQWQQGLPDSEPKKFFRIQPDAVMTFAP